MLINDKGGEKFPKIIKGERITKIDSGLIKEGDQLKFEAQK